MGRGTRNITHTAALKSGRSSYENISTQRPNMTASLSSARAPPSSTPCIGRESARPLRPCGMPLEIYFFFDAKSIFSRIGIKKDHVPATDSAPARMRARFPANPVSRGAECALHRLQSGIERQNPQVRRAHRATENGIRSMDQGRPSILRESARAHRRCAG
jgi:hypothetical protein